MSESLDSFISTYVNAAEGYARCIMSGDAKKGDRFFDEIEKVFLSIRKLGDEGLDGLSGLLVHQSEGVRLWAAAHLLNYPRYHSEQVLKTIIGSGTVLGLTAEITLDQWKNGMLKY